MKYCGQFAGWIVLAGMAAAIAAPPTQTPDEQTLITAHLATDGPALLAYFKMRTVSDADRQRIVAMIRQLGDESFAVRERAAMELTAIGLPAVGLLRQGQVDPDVEIARRCQKCLAQIERVPSTSLSAAAARLVAVRKPAGAVGVLLAYLPLADDNTVADEVREALVALGSSGGRIDPLLNKALDDPQPIRRGAAAEVLIRSGQPEGIAAGRKALEDSNLDVRLRAALALVVHARDKQSMPAMIGLLGDLPQASGWRVEEVLIRLAGTDAPQVSLGGDDAARSRCRDAWKSWWDKHGASIDLAKLDGADPVLGYTLLVVRDQRAITGRVMEINATRDVMWKIENLQMPLDAVVVGKDRVLIAEQSNQQISERDFQGRVIWRKQTAMAVGVQRLPNGHTLVVARNQLAEWDKNRNVVWQYNRPARFDIIAARRLKSGETVFVTNSGECIRLDANRKEVKSFSLGPNKQYSYGGIDELPGGNLLLTTRDSVAEYDRDGHVRWSAAASRPISAQRLANGNTLIANSGAQNVIELDRKGKQSWEYRPTDSSFVYRARRR